MYNNEHMWNSRANRSLNQKMAANGRTLDMNQGGDQVMLKKVNGQGPFPCSRTWPMGGDSWLLVLLHAWNSWPEVVHCVHFPNKPELLGQNPCCVCVSPALGGWMAGSWLTPSDNRVLEDGICGREPHKQIPGIY